MKRTMRNFRCAALAALLALQTSRIDGDEPAPTEGHTASRESVLEAGLTTLRVRMQARIKEVEILRERGKPDEALRVLREIEQGYSTSLEDLRRLVHGSSRSLLPSDGSDLFAEYAAFDPLPMEGSVFGKRGSYLRRTSGTGPPNRAAQVIIQGLRWLAAHQSPDGGWHVAEVDRWCDGKENASPRPDGRGKAGHDVGATGLAVAAYLGMGYTWRGDHDFVHTVARAVGFLRAQQRADGGFSPRTTVDWIIEDACCALAAVEAYGLTGQQSLRPVAQQALDHLASIRTPAGVWGCGWAPGPEDEHTTGWATLPFLSARHVNEACVATGLAPPFRFDAELLGTVARWCERWSDTAAGTFSPRRPQTRLDTDPVSTFTDSAVHLALPTLIHPEPPTPGARAQKDTWLSSRTPTWTSAPPSVNLTAWTFSTLAAYRLGGAAERAWTQALHASDSEPTGLLRGQVTAGTHCDSKGSWEPADPRWASWGRVASTALMTAMLESFWHRYPPLPGPAEPR